MSILERLIAINIGLTLDSAIVVLEQVATIGWL